MFGFNITKIGLLTLLFYCSIGIALWNTTEMIALSIYGIDIREYVLFVNPLAIDDVEVRVIISWLYVGINYMILNNTKKKAD